MEINFIKFLFEKAGDPFKVMVYPNCTNVYFPSREHSVFIEEFEKCCPDYVKSFLLQRAIEGVNKDLIDSKHFIKQDCMGCTVYEYGGKNQSLYNLEYAGEDPAKKSALKYIYEQEKL